MPRAARKKKPETTLPAKPRRGGPPSRYRPEMCDQVYEYGLLGLTEPEVARELGIGETQLGVWKKLYPDFGDALKRSKIPADSKVARSLYERAVGYRYTEQQAIKIKTGKDQEDVKVVEVERFAPPDTASMAIWLRNRQPERWRDSRKIEYQGTLEHRLASMNAEERAAWSEELAARAMRLLEAPMIEHEDIPATGDGE